MGTPVVNENSELKNVAQTEVLENETVENNVSESAVDEVEKEDCAVGETKETLVEKLKNLLKAEDSKNIREEVASVKQQFYKIQKAEVEKIRNEFVEQGGLIQDFKVEVDEVEQEMKKLLAEYKELRAKEQKEIEEKEAANLLKKQQIIERLKILIESTDDAGKVFPEFRSLQQEWNAVGQVPVEHANDIYKSHQQLVEQFYDYVKISNELRDYDFKKNKEAKQELILQAEKLDEEGDVVKAFKNLQRLHDEWKKIGPVAKELREEVWNQFKEVSTVINKKHQQHFEQLKGKEEDNLKEKEVICEQIESIVYDDLKNRKDWDAKTAEVLELQKKWRTIGFAPKKVNEKIYQRFRETCDKFFALKNEFLKSFKDELLKNLEKKTALCEQAEALKDSTDWRSTTDKLIQIQKEWKTIGQVPRKHSETIWKRFIAACDYFFHQKEGQTESAKKEEENNFSAKQEVIDKINAIQHTEDNEKALQELKSLIAEFNSIGHVPFKKKDNIYKLYREAIDKQFDALHIDKKVRRIHDFKVSVEGMNDAKNKSQIYKERDKLIRIFESLKNELQTYENNMGFLNVKSGKSNTLLKELEKKIEKIKKEKEEVFEKIRIIDDAIVK